MDKKKAAPLLTPLKECGRNAAMIKEPKSRQSFGLPSIPITEVDRTRFWKKVDKKPSGCWEWVASKDTGGYGHFWIGGHKGEYWKAHRLAWVLSHPGGIPNGLHVLHKCDNPGCVNFKAHLFLGTHRENMADMAKKDRAQKQSGEAHPGAILSKSKVEDIRFRLWLGEKGRDIANEFGVDEATISAIKHRRIWA